jgi:hypothetical protein
MELYEHKDYICGDCGSTFIRYDHLDDKDCDDACDNPCLLRMCNEDYCLGIAILKEEVQYV